MRYLRWILRILLFLVLLGFAIKNTDPVVVRYFLGWEWHAPLTLVLLVFFAARRRARGAGGRRMAVQPAPGVARSCGVSCATRIRRSSRADAGRRLL